MSSLGRIGWGVLFLSISLCAGAGAQDNPQAPTPVPAFGQANTPILNPENPPLSGLDEPSLELKTASRSFISPALQVGESADSNPSNSLNGSRAEAVSHVLGAFDLQKFWPRSDLFLEYLGGAAFGDSPYYVRQVEAVGLEGVTRWRTGRLTLRDSASYLPDGSLFAATAGGFPGFGIAMGAGMGVGLPGIYHLAVTSVGTIPRFSNTGILDMVQAITPRSAFTLVGAFSNARFYHNTDDLANGDETTVEGGYSHLVSRHDQVAAVFAFQLFRFPVNTGGEIYNYVFNVRWSHTINGRMSFIGEVGPQYTDLQFGISSPNLSVAGRAALRYRFQHTSLTASYEKYTAEGGGFFAGSERQVAEVTLRRPLGRTYEVSAEAGYAHNHRLQAAVIPGAGVGGAKVYNEGYAGAILRKHLGRAFDAIAGYRFAEVAFDVPVTLGGTKGKINQRQIGTIALEWHPKPTRIE